MLYAFDFDGETAFRDGDEFFLVRVEVERRLLLGERNELRVREVEDYGEGEAVGGGAEDVGADGAFEASGRMGISKDTGLVFV